MKTVKLLSVILMGVVLSACQITTELKDGSFQTKQVNSFDQVASSVHNSVAKYGAENVLVVVDIDNTLLTSDTDLGSDIWYQWQRNKLAVKPTPSQQVACLFEDAIGLLYELAPMQLTEASVPTLIEQWQQQGVVVFGLTSRSPKYRAATERELLSNGIDLTGNPLTPHGNSGFIFREMHNREVSYMQGIMMTTGLNKGEMLSLMLAKTGAEFKAIIFVDDSQKNITDLTEHFSASAPADMTVFHYTRIEHLREQQHGTVLTQQQANAMAADWDRLQHTLNQVFPTRVRQGCLSTN